MLAGLINQFYPKHYAVMRVHIPILELSIRDNQFSIKDEICPEPDDTGIKLSGFNEGTLNILNPGGCSISILEWEKYVSQFNGIRAGEGKRCDILITDNQLQIVFCELTETDPLFIEPHTNSYGDQPGKRATAVLQITNSINKVLQVPELSKIINGIKTKTGLFACRYPKPIVESLINRSFELFNEPLTLISNVSYTAPNLAHDFVFEQRIFPKPFELN